MAGPTVTTWSTLTGGVCVVLKASPQKGVVERALIEPDGSQTRLPTPGALQA